MATAEDDIKAVKGSLRAHKGHLTRLIEEGDRVKAFAAHNPSAFVVQQLETAYAAISSRHQRIQDCYIRLQELDPDNFDAYDTRMDEVSKRFDAIGADLLRVHANCSAPAAPLLATAPTLCPDARVKIDDTLKPTKLTDDHGPVEMRNWLLKFRAWYTTSAMDRRTIGEQQAYFFLCLGSTLETRMRLKVEPTTPIFEIPGDDTSVVSLLEEDFLQRYPIFMRRLEYFRFDQAANQDAVDWIAKLEQKGNEADLHRLSVDQIHVFRVICGCTDKRLREKFLKIKEPTLEKIKEEARVYAAASTITKAFEKPHRGARVTDRPREDKEGKKSIDKMKKKRRCDACGIFGHGSVDCHRKDKLTCHACGKPGHIAPMCRSKAKSRPGSRPGTRPSSPSRPQESNEQRYTSSAGAATKLVTCNVATDFTRPTPRLHARFRTGDISFHFNATPDTGATRSIIAQDVLRHHGISFDTSSSLNLFAANGSHMRCAGTVQLQVLYDGRPEIIVDALVSPDLRNEILLSWHDLLALQVIPVDFPATIAAAVADDSLERLQEDFPDVLRNTLGTHCLRGSPMKIHLRDDVEIRPKKVTTARQFPLHWQAEADREIQRLLDGGILAPVTTPTDWISPGGFVEKPDGSLRLITNFIALNKFVRRPVHPFPCTQEILQGIDASSKYFAKMDAVQGYFQIPLDDTSSQLTTFLLPSGRYRYLRAPMGLCASSDEWCQRSDVALQGLPGVSKLVDDVLVQAPNEHTLLSRIRQVLERCRAHGITISRRKLQIGREVKFAGHIISAKGIMPDPAKTAALSAYPTPHDITSLRSFLGLANQLGHFVPDLAQMSKHLRGLLKKNIAFLWLDEHQQEFEAIKAALTSPLVVSHFNPSLPTEMLTDASRHHGLGYMLVQYDAEGHMRLIHCGSRSLTETESRYATIELECLAIKYAIDKCSFYLKGMGNFTVVTDHRPLLGIFKKDLHTLPNPRLLRLREKIMGYTFDVRWTAGKTHLIADALSRAPVFKPEEEEEEEGLYNAFLCRAVSTDPAMQPLFDAIRDDDNYQSVISALRSGKSPAQLHASHPAKAFGNVWDHLSLLDDEKETLIIYDDTRIVVPAAARPEVLRRLHVPHAGLVKTRKAAQQLYYWPGINNSIKQLVESCSTCQSHLPSQPHEPLQLSDALGPFSHVGVDLLEFAGQHWVCMVDRYSGFPFTKKLRSLTTTAVLTILETWFRDWGFPTVIRTDGGPQFRTEFDDFCKAKGIIHELSSPYNPRSNGLAESGVKAVKTLLSKCHETGEDFFTALTEWRNVPRADGFSPAQMLLGRRQRGLLPALPPDDINHEEAVAARRHARDTGAAYHDAHAHPLPTLSQGQRVLIQHPLTKKWDSHGTVSDIREDGRSYEIQTDRGTAILRNRRFLRPCSLQVPTADSAMDNHPSEEASGHPRRSPRLIAKKSVHFSSDLHKTDNVPLQKRFSRHRLRQGGGQGRLIR